MAFPEGICFSRRGALQLWLWSVCAAVPLPTHLVFMLGPALRSVCGAACWGSARQAGTAGGGPLAQALLLCCSSGPRTSARAPGPESPPGGLHSQGDRSVRCQRAAALRSAVYGRGFKTLHFLHQHCRTQGAQADRSTRLQSSGAFSWKTQVWGLTSPSSADGCPAAHGLVFRPRSILKVISLLQGSEPWAPKSKD